MAIEILSRLADESRIRAFATSERLTTPLTELNEEKARSSEMKTELD